MPARHVLLAALAALVCSLDARAQAPRIAQWVEYAPASDVSKLALGYPVPVPVDSPLPFDGFRSYSGLLARHQDLAATTAWVHPVPLGATRQGRTIWLYRLGDGDLDTVGGEPEQAMLTNGGIHAREWQSPEVVTGIIELLALGPDDHHLLSYLRDNANVLVIPVLNIDGYLQAQRYPDTNWLGTDPDDPQTSPRDGRMRRKNMRDVDDDLQTRADHLQGVDLNRNNLPYWNTNPERSSGDPESIVYHGIAPASEPETLALQAAAQQGPLDRLNMFTDVHSFSQVHLWVRNDNARLANLTEGLLRTFSNFHRSFPARKNYVFQTASQAPRNTGIGTTDEYFGFTYQVPSWTLEIEPSDGAYYHAPLPGAGADYGGLGRNSHDGFILPDAEIARVRTELARAFAVAYYRQSGPPAVTRMLLTDEATGSVVLQAAWDTVDAGHRDLHVFQPQALQLDREYRAWVAFNKPMRWRSNGDVTALPGQPAGTLEINRSIGVAGDPLDTVVGAPRWLDQPGASPDGYHHYRDDAVDYSLRIPATADNLVRVSGTVTGTFRLRASDMTGNLTDADPATVAHWADGGWSGYEDSAGDDLTDTGGADATVSLAITSEELGEPFVIEPGISAAWYDPRRDGEGFLLEVLANDRAVMYWFTYDDQRRQDWYVAEGAISGNRILFPELLRVSGGTFGPGFDPDRVVRSVVGSAGFVWSSCDSGEMEWRLDTGDVPQQGRMYLTRLSRLMGLDCGRPVLQPVLEMGTRSGSWYDPRHSGEGYALEVLADLRALVYWFGFDAQGQRRWFFGVGGIQGESLVFNDMLTTSGALFGPAYDPADVTLSPWGFLRLDLGGTQGTAVFEPTEAGFPAGTLELERLTWLDGL